MLAKGQNFKCLKGKAKINNLKLKNSNSLKRQINNSPKIKDIKFKKNNETKTKN